MPEAIQVPYSLSVNPLYVRLYPTNDTVVMAALTAGDKYQYVTDSELTDAGLSDVGTVSTIYEIFQGDTPDEDAEDIVVGSGVLRRVDGVTSTNSIVELSDDQLDQIVDSVVDQVQSKVRTSGGSFRAKISTTTVGEGDYLEIIQGEQKTLTFIIEAALGMFELAVPEFISVKIADPDGNVISITETESDSPIDRVAQETDIQVFRVTLNSSQTAELQSGLARIEVTVDSQKARMIHSLKMIEQIADEESES